MHEQYGLKRSSALRICKVLAFLLFLTFILSLTFMFVDEKTLDSLNSKKLSEERKQELLTDDSFKLAVRLGYEIKMNPDTYGAYEALKSITHIVCSTRNSYGITSTKTMLSVEKNNGSILYFQYLNGFILSTVEVYNEYSREGINKFILVDETFSGKEAGYIVELLSSEETENLIYELKKEEVISKKYWKILIKFTHNVSEIRNNSRNILTMCIGSPYNDEKAMQRAVIRVTLDNDEQLFYMLINGGSYNEVIAEIDSGMYASFSQNEYCFNNYDFDVLFKETGVWQ